MNARRLWGEVRARSDPMYSASTCRTNCCTIRYGGRDNEAEINEHIAAAQERPKKIVDMRLGLLESQLVMEEGLKLDGDGGV